MKARAIILTLLSVLTSCLCVKAETKVYTGDSLNHIAYPIGGLGSGMFCIEGTGAISNMSVHHYPELFNEPCTYSAIWADGKAKVLEGPVPKYKIFGRQEGGMGVGGTTWGLPRFSDCAFSARFPFAEISLRDSEMKVAATIKAWNPFIPDDEDNSGLPVAGLEYTFTNVTNDEVQCVFSFNTKNFMARSDKTPNHIDRFPGGFVLVQDPDSLRPEAEGSFAVWTNSSDVSVDHCWFRGGWFDPLTMSWNKVSSGDTTGVPPAVGSPGASLYVPFTLNAGGSRTIMVRFAWYVPHSFHRMGALAENDNDRGPVYNAADWKNVPKTYEPYYSRKFFSVNEVASYWESHCDSLRRETALFTDTFYDTTLPKEVVEAVAANLTILKSSTVMRQHDGRFWAWEGSGDNWGSCHGSCTHVWNYAQALPHLFPRMERSLRETEFLVDQNCDGHQVFRANIPISPVHHDFHSAADGQLGGIMKVYRDWRISGDTQWIKNLYPRIKESLDYCIRTWDPNYVGAIEKPHHNTYDIEFWGPGGMCTSIYAGALNSFITISKALGEPCAEYENLLEKTRRYLTSTLWNGEYFFQKVRWKDLGAGDPAESQMFNAVYSPEALAVLEEEGPKYQYGSGCLSDGVIGCWMSLVCGLDEPIDSKYVKSHLNSVYKYNLCKNLSSHANPQRPGYAVGHDGGLLLCTWPHGGKPKLPFVYSDEVWTGIEYQVAAHLVFEGEVEKGLDIVRTLRKRYDGTVRNPFNEYECGSWYARAMASYSLLQALTGVRYDAVSKTLVIDSKIGADFRSFISTASGYGTLGLKNGKPFIDVKRGNIVINKIIVK